MTARERSRARALGAAALSVAPALPAVAGVLLLFVAPLLLFVVYSFLTMSGMHSVSAPLTFDSYAAGLGSPLYQSMLFNAALIGVLTSFCTVLLALPIAFWIRFSAGRWQTLFLFLFAATLFASYLVRIYAWRTMLGGNGLLNSTLMTIGLIEEPLEFLLFNRFAVVLALAHLYLPYVVLVLYAAFRALPPELLELADDLGARPIATWRRVVVPTILQTAVTAGMFIFILAASDYVTPQFLGGTSGTMIGVGIQQAFIAQGNWPLGAAISLITLAAFGVCYLIAILGMRLITRRQKVAVA